MAEDVKDPRSALVGISGVFRITMSSELVTNWQKVLDGQRVANSVN